MDVPLYGGALRMQLPKLVLGRPVKFDDMSTLRQVPNHQEVFSDVDCGCAVIIEVLSREETVSCGEIATYHFNELAKANGCTQIRPGVAVNGDNEAMYDAVVMVAPVNLPNEACPYFPNGPITNANAKALETPTTTGAKTALQQQHGIPVVEGKYVIEGKQLISKYRRPTPASSSTVNPNKSQSSNDNEHIEEDKRNEVYIGLAVIRLAPPVDTEILVSISAPIVVSPGSSEAAAMGPGGPLTLEQAQEVLRVVLANLEVVRWSLFL